jgi:hypothetical protein
LKEQARIETNGASDRNMEYLRREICREIEIEKLVQVNWQR